MAGSAACDKAVESDLKVSEVERKLDDARLFAQIWPPALLQVEVLEALLEATRQGATERLCAPAPTGGPGAGAAAAVRGGGTLTAGGQRYSIAVDARTTTAGTTSGRFALSGGGADTTAASRTLTSVARTSTGATVTGTAVAATGRPTSVTVTVVDKPGGRDQVTVRISGRTLAGTLTTGDIQIT
ncbi:hypothetical protein WCD74_13915 [Actinomycetospora sp. OC33-EN08]|uniref:Uncharacterized protein n=1 Tax=Actinomycetospora aurantiaca TaxID=3129233 RepID=A0ABU8MNG6_9PSEU